jgi:uncharacterized protein
MKIVRPLLIAALLIAHPSAQAASFDCSKGRSLAEKIICNDPALSRLDDTLGRLYWKARRTVSDRRGFIADSDSKWAWREANCRDAECLGTWYAARIGELEQVIAGVWMGASGVDPTMLQCTAAHPGIVIGEQCASVIKQNGSQWNHQTPHGGDWFCGVAMLGRT